MVQIEHHGLSLATGEPYRLHALGVVRVRDGKIVHYTDYVDPIAIAEAFGRTPELVAALSQP